MGFLDYIKEVGISEKVKLNFNLRYEQYKNAHPDQSVLREHELRPCPYYFHYIDVDGNKYAEFFRTHFSALARRNELNNNKSTKNGIVISRISGLDVMTDYYGITDPFDLWLRPPFTDQK